VTGEHPLGNLLLERAREARQRVLLCAPFVKSTVLERLLTALDSGVEIELFTRWRPEEVAAGVSDTTVLTQMKERKGRVFLCDPLHAKLFRFDELTLIGSANLTAKALGWTPDSNLELLVEVAVETTAVEDLESALRAASIPATAEIATEIERVAALLPKAPKQVAERGASVSPREPTGALAWRPHSREPRDLYRAYVEGVDRLTEVSAASATEDLIGLEVPPGLDREQFELLVGTRLLQAPLIQRIDDLLSRSRRFGEMRDVLAEELGLDRGEATHAWQTTMRWMLYFLPRRYGRSVPSHSEIMVRKETP
jgi:PLD-like domain